MLCKYHHSTKLYQLFINCMQLQGFPIDSHTVAWVSHMIMFKTQLKFYNCHMKRSEIWLVLPIPGQWKLNSGKLPGVFFKLINGLVTRLMHAQTWRVHGRIDNSKCKCCIYGPWWSLSNLGITMLECESGSEGCLHHTRAGQRKGNVIE